MNAPAIPPERLAAFREQVVHCDPPYRKLEVARVEDRVVDGVRIRVYTPMAKGSHPLIVYVHGAGFVAGNLDSHDGIQRFLCDALEAIVVAIDYRLAPEHPWPAAYDDVYTVLRWLQAHGRSIGANDRGMVVAGESAGAHLAATVAMRARDDTSAQRPLITQQVLLYAVLDAVNPVYGAMFNSYFPNALDARSAMGSPVYAQNLVGLPPAFCLWGQWEPTRAEQELYARRLTEAGVSVKTHMAPDIGHGVYELKAASSRSDVLDAIACSIRSP
jgi:acetyl esterase